MVYNSSTDFRNLIIISNDNQFPFGRFNEFDIFYFNNILWAPGDEQIRDA